MLLGMNSRVKTSEKKGDAWGGARAARFSSVNLPRYHNIIEGHGDSRARMVEEFQNREKPHHHRCHKSSCPHCFIQLLFFDIPLLLRVRPPSIDEDCQTNCIDDDCLPKVHRISKCSDESHHRQSQQQHPASHLRATDEAMQAALGSSLSISRLQGETKNAKLQVSLESPALHE